jgi:hypothetical protein
MKNVVPLTGLPRSGTTMLMHLLNQNPLFEIGNVSELSYLLSHIRQFSEDVTQYSHLQKYKLHQCIIDFCRSGSVSWVKNLCDDDKLFLDKHRYWLYQYNFIFKLFPNIKFIVPIRDLCGIVNSLEKINHTNLSINTQKLYTNLNDNFYCQRILSHLDAWYLKDGLFSIKEILEVPNNYLKNILFIRYEDVLKNPKNSIKLIYDFLEISKFNHDFENINQDDSDIKNYYLPYGDHQIKSKIEPLQDNVYLVDDTKKFIISNYEWYYKKFYPEVVSKYI